MHKEVTLTTPSEKEQKLDELSQKQIAQLWLDGAVSAEEALASFQREGGFSILLMEVIAHHLLRKL